MSKSTPVWEISEQQVKRVATILGASSAAAKALDRGAELADQGIDVGYYQMGNTILVGPRLSNEDAEITPTPD